MVSPLSVLRTAGGISGFAEIMGWSLRRLRLDLLIGFASIIGGLASVTMEAFGRGNTVTIMMSAAFASRPRP
jgi:hypothetical protein